MNFLIRYTKAIIDMSFNSVYDQSKMRQHFLDCLERGEMKPFPSELVRSKRPVRIKNTVALRLPSARKRRGNNGFCKRWFHKTCQSIPEGVFDQGYKKVVL